MTKFTDESRITELSKKFHDDPWHPYTLGELIQLEETSPLSHLVVAQAMAQENSGYGELLEKVLASFEHNLDACEVGLTRGNSFLLGKVASDLDRENATAPALIDDELINRALTYTLAAEVGNHEVGLQPCAGTGDSCPYTGLVRSLLESSYSRERVGQVSSLILKIGSIFRAGKSTTGCNMEGLGAGAAATAAAMTDLLGGTGVQAGKAVVLALSPTLAVPCTPRVMVPGLCATHITSAILTGNTAARLVLKTDLPVTVDVDVMLALATRLHREAAPVITPYNLSYLGPFFNKNDDVDSFVDDEVLVEMERERTESLKRSRDEVRALVSQSEAITHTFGEVVVGGSSIAVGSPTNMGRICHELFEGDITGIEIDLTIDLFSRRAINVPGILMGAVYGAKTNDMEKYRSVMDDVLARSIPVAVRSVDKPEVQRISITASGRSAAVDSLNRGGGRIAIVDATPSREDALAAAERLGIKVVD